MTKLHQLVAVLNGKKTKTLAEITDLHQKCQKPALFAGQSRTYRSLDAAGERLPDETTLPQERVSAVIDRACEQWQDWLDLTLSVDSGGTLAKADVEVDGKMLLKNVPVLHLIFLEQQLNDVRKFVATLPVLDANYQWSWDEAKDMHVTQPVEQNRSIKSKQVIQLAPATDKHPEQAQLIDVDKWVGVYTTTRFATGVRADHKRQYLDRVDRLIDAVKTAREQANSIEVEQRKEAVRLFEYIFA
jgi:hypothetical protein